MASRKVNDDSRRLSRRASLRRSHTLVRALLVRVSPVHELGLALQAYLAEFSGDGYSSADFLAFTCSQLMALRECAPSKPELRAVLIELLRQVA